jgi:hypothetical protein
MFIPDSGSKFFPSRIQIPDTDPDIFPSPIPDPAVKKTLDPGSGSASATLILIGYN